MGLVIDLIHDAAQCIGVTIRYYRFAVFKQNRIDSARREATINDRQLTLRTKEFDLLLTLAQNPGIVLTRDQLLELVWGSDFYGETRTVDIHITHLREKISESNVSIETVRGVGYKMISNVGK